MSAYRDRLDPQGRRRYDAAVQRAGSIYAAAKRELAAQETQPPAAA